MHNTLSNHDRIVITGVGVISSLGTGIESLRTMLAQTQGSDRALIAIPSGRLIDTFSGCVDDFGELPTAAKRTLRKSLKLMNRETQMGVAAAYQAIRDASLDAAGYDSERVGVCFGAGNVEIRPEDFVSGIQACAKSSYESIEALWGSTGIQHVDPLWVLRVLPNMPACHIAIGCDYRGPNNTITQAEASANQAADEARWQLLDDEADAMIVGSTGTAIRYGSNGEADNADVAICSEAAGGFVLERLDAAEHRDATIYGEVLGMGSSCVIDTTHVPKPDEAIRNAVRSSLKRSNYNEVATIFFSVCNDDVAANAMDRSLRQGSAGSLNLSRWIGHADAGSGAIGLAASLMHLRNGPASQNDAAMNLAITKNGLASCLVVRPFQSLRAA